MGHQGADPTLVAVMDGVREHGEKYPVELRYFEENGRLVIVASNEGGFGHTYIDLLDLIAWVKVGHTGDRGVMHVVGSDSE